MSDAQLTPLQQWLIEVAAQAKQRPWIDWSYCVGCEKDEILTKVRHKDDCPFAALDAALDKEPT